MGAFGMSGVTLNREERPRSGCDGSRHPDPEVTAIIRGVGTADGPLALRIRRRLRPSPG